MVHVFKIQQVQGFKKGSGRFVSQLKGIWEIGKQVVELRLGYWRMVMTAMTVVNGQVWVQYMGTLKS
jgi:hypothetical protein